MALADVLTLNVSRTEKRLVSGFNKIELNRELLDSNFKFVGDNFTSFSCTMKTCIVIGIAVVLNK